MTHNLSVPQRFAEAVALHIVRNLLWDYYDFRIPLILGIHGPSGEGKSFQVGLILQEMKVTSVQVFANELESPRAGEPANLVCERYLTASNLVIEGEASAAALLINDLDAVIGKWGQEVQYTVNTQLVVGTLMSIADHPHSVRGVRTNRVPIIVTGNDFTTLYGPLTREGRMSSFPWLPTLEEKIEVVRTNIFRDGNLNGDDIRTLVTRFADKPIAFFALLRSSVYDAAILSRIRSVGLARIVSAIHREPGEGLIDEAASLAYLLERGEDLASLTMKRYLG